MPNYNTQLINSIFPGDTVLAFNAEQPAPPQASQQFSLVQQPGGVVQSLSVEIKFSGAPGAFRVDVQDADTDTEENYKTVGSGSIVAVDANNTARAEFSPFKAKFVRIRLVNRTNAVNLTARISR